MDLDTVDWGLAAKLDDDCPLLSLTLAFRLSLSWIDRIPCGIDDKDSIDDDDEEEEEEAIVADFDAVGGGILDGKDFMEFRGILAISKPKEFLRFFNGSRLKLGDISESGRFDLVCSFEDFVFIFKFLVYDGVVSCWNKYETNYEQIFLKTNNNSNQFIYTGK